MTTTTDNKKDDIVNIEENSRLLAAVNVPSEYGSGPSDRENQNMAIIDGVEVRLWTQVMAGLSSTIGAVAAGLLLGWTALLEDEIKTTTYPFTLNDEQFSWIGSMFTLGSATVCIPIGFLLNALGRKTAMLILVLPFTIGHLLIIFAQNPAMLYIGRYVLGLAGGAFCISAPVYTAEISSKQIRGTLGTFFQLSLVIGILLAYILGALFKAITCTIISAVVPLIFGAVFFFMPESPLYYIRKDKTEKAIKSLTWLRGPNYNVNSELAAMQADHEESKESKSLAVVFGKRATKRALFISLGLMLFQQMSGINAVIFYSGSIYTEAQSDPQKGTVMVGIVQFIATLVSTLIVDRVGRKVLLLLSGSIMMLCTITLGVYFHFLDNDKDVIENVSWLPVVCLCLFIAAFSIGYGPVPWLMVGEVFATEAKGVAGPISGTFNWLLAFLVTKTFKSLTNALGSALTFWLFSGFSFIGVFFVWFIVIETKNKTLFEIQDELGEEKNK